jgi:L-fuconolactonase
VRIIDAHQHLWDTAALRYPWLEGFDALRQRYTAADYRQAAAGIEVVRSVHVEADPAPDDEAAEVHWLTGIAREDGMIGAIVAAAPLERPDRRAVLARLTENPLVVGIRRMAWHRPDPDFYRTPGLIEGVHALADYGLTFDLCAHTDQLHAAIALVRETPEIAHAINHCGGPDIAGGRFQPWADAMSELAAFPHTVCKVSGLVTRTRPGWTREDLKPYIDHLVSAFGYGRLLFGSDWPVCTLAAEYRQWLDALMWAVQGASDEEQRRLFHDNARRFYRIKD